MDLEVVTKVAEWFSTKKTLLSTKEILKKDANAVANDEEKLEMRKIDLLLDPPFNETFGPEAADAPPAQLRETTRPGESRHFVGQYAELGKADFATQNPT